MRKEKQEKRDLLSQLVQPRGADSLFCPDWCYQPGPKGPFVPVARPGTKGPPLLSRPGGPGLKAGTKSVSQSGQISVSVVVNPPSLTDRGRHAWLNTYMPTTDKIDIVLDTYTLIYTDLYDQVVDEGFI